MKLIENINIALSYGKGQKLLLFENKEEVLAYYPDICNDMIDALNKLEKDNSVLGFIKAHTFNSFEKDFDFIAVYKKEEELGDLRIVFSDVRVYTNFIINFNSEADFRSKMVKIDRGDINGFLTLNEF